MKEKPKKSEMESFTSEYAMSGADNALSRKQLNAAIIAQEAVIGNALANESQHQNTFEKGLAELQKKKDGD